MSHQVSKDLKKDSGVDIPLLNDTFKDIIRYGETEIQI